MSRRVLWLLAAAALCGHVASLDSASSIEMQVLDGLFGPDLSAAGFLQDVYMSDVRVCSTPSSQRASLRARLAALGGGSAAAAASPEAYMRTLAAPFFNSGVQVGLPPPVCHHRSPLLPSLNPDLLLLLLSSAGCGGAAQRDSAAVAAHSR